MRNLTVFAALAAVFGLSACNSTLDQRTAQRIGTGAVVGAVGTALLDGDPVKGAIVGGVVGGITSKDRHVWE
ncbi:hypothetical protein [Neptunicoccus sediminis]|uniref:hypothetical protein n=1 Tax=Neptunicoccus sediminis TaxID=1892596 RepID=UPI00084607F6|nr:hypothetical protein [Neptunicoccus sediminis]